MLEYSDSIVYWFVWKGNMFSENIHCHEKNVQSGKDVNRWSEMYAKYNDWGFYSVCVHRPVLLS